jgi:hypothetical protein
MQAVHSEGARMEQRKVLNEWECELKSRQAPACMQAGINCGPCSCMHHYGDSVAANTPEDGHVHGTPLLAAKP